MNVEKKKELERLYERDGSLDPATLVREAADPMNPFHSDFEWDDTKAAAQHRLNQARAIIRISVVIIPSLNTEPVRMFVSLSDRRGDKTNGGSYLSMVDVISDAERYAQAREDALAMLRSLSRRFNYVAELGPIWQALAEVVASVEKSLEKAR